MSISQWPSHERPREKLLSLGPQALSDAELLAIFLRTGCAGRSAVDLARDLLTYFGNLRTILESSEAEFCSAKGLGAAKYTQLQACLEMSRRHLSENLEYNNTLNSPQAVKTFLIAQLRHETSEVFSVLHLNSQHYLIRYETLFKGTINSANVHPREVVKSILKYNSAAVILAHNHPSGHAEPSKADKMITRRLVQALDLIDVKILDHIVIGEGQEVSFAERGLL